MSRSASRRSSSVQAEKTLPPVAPHTDHPTDERSGTTGKAPLIPWTWRIVLFLWATSLAFLFLYEWLAAIVKNWNR